MFESKTAIFSIILFNQLLSIPILNIVEDNIFKLHDKLTYDEVPSFHIIIYQLIFGQLLQDFIYYFLHRLLHINYFYKIHKTHHEYKKTFSILAYYLHPLDLFISHFAYLGDLKFVLEIFI